MSTVQNAISPTHQRRHSKTGPLLRQSSLFRTVFFVTVDLVGFTGANAFLYYLSTGHWMDLSMGSYKTALASPLSEVLLRPLSIFEQPWMMPVAGLLITTVVFVPIMVAVLYRMSVSALFVLVVAVVGHAPLLAGFLAGGCIIAGRTGLRRDLPLVALLGGLAPTVVYFYFFSGGDEQSLPPLQRISVHLILVLALMAAALAGAVVSVLARITRFRPGVIWPVILVLLAAPTWVFFEKVGSGKLDYALIATRIGPGEAIFAPPDFGELSRATKENIFYPVRPPTSSSPSSRPTSQQADAISESELGLLVRARVTLGQQQTTLTAECEKFIRRHPDSIRAAAVMWIIATAKDVRIDQLAFSAGSVLYVYTGPSAESNGAWANLAERHPRQPQAFVAHQRLGIQAIREGRIQKAREHLRIAQTLLATYLGQQDSDAPTGPARDAAHLAGVFDPDESLPGREYYRKILDETDNIIWLMETNKVLDGELKNVEAFRDYMRLWPFTGAKSKELQDLEKDYQDTNLADNFRLQAALSQENKLDRALQLSQLAGEIDDAAIAANYELGLLALRLEKTPAWSKMNLKTAEHYFKVSKSAQDNPYRTSAEQHLTWLAGRKQPATMPNRNTETP